MARLIVVPQYPAALRYQEWWYTELPKNYRALFEDVVVLGADVEKQRAEEGSFAPMETAISFEMRQIEQYLALELQDSDVLLLCDLSFPGLFCNVLFHKRPKHCFAICHATSKNRYDYFYKDRREKWKVETAHARLFDKVFVATEYHKNKLGWKNIEVVGLPLLPNYRKNYDPLYPLYLVFPNIVSVSRPGIQKRNKNIEGMVESELGIKIETRTVDTWAGYNQFLYESRMLLITSKEETFGYQVLDALVNGCIPIAPFACSYPELLPRKYLYANYAELTNIITSVVFGHLKLPKLLNEAKCQAFFARTTEVMLR